MDGARLAELAYGSMTLFTVTTHDISLLCEVICLNHYEIGNRIW